jgi:hypothetical protein
MIDSTRKCTWHSNFMVPLLVSGTGQAYGTEHSLEQLDVASCWKTRFYLTGGVVNFIGRRSNLDVGLFEPRVQEGSFKNSVESN